MWLLENKKTSPTRLLWSADHFILKEGISIGVEKSQG
jgi:hypothetical protein